MEKNQNISVKDGIINEDEFKKAPVKILWVLKEPYAKEGEVKDLDGDGYLKFFREYREHTHLAAPTVHKIIYASYAILKNKLWEEISYIDDDPNIIEVLNDIAIINIKKVPNIESKTSNKKEIKSYFIKNLDNIKKQIIDINPNIVIWAFWNILELKEFRKEILSCEKEVEKPTGCCDVYDFYDYKLVNNVLHIIVDHPSAPFKNYKFENKDRKIEKVKINEEDYVNEIKNIYCKVFKCEK